jgi:hypothetical protein
MKNYIEHVSFVNLTNKDSELWSRLLRETELFNTFLNLIKKEGKGFRTFGYSEEQGKFKMVGDLFEIFSEVFFKVLGADNRVGVYNYTPENGVDNGVDGFGLGIDGQPCAIQVKFRSFHDSELTAADLKQFGFQAITRYGVDKDTKNNMIIITSAKGLHWYTANEVFLGRLRTIASSQIRKLVDRNHCFWNLFRDYIQTSLEVHYG